MKTETGIKTEIKTDNAAEYETESKMETEMERPMELSLQKANEYIYEVLTIAERMLKSGAEVSRVEDTIERLGKALGSKRVDVFCITSNIWVTMHFENLGPVTQMRRAKGAEFDLHQLERLNALSRNICEKHLSIEEVRKELSEISEGKKYRFWEQVIIFAMISASFSLFFGGSLKDAAAASVIGVALKFMDTLTKRAETNKFLAAFACSLAGGVLANAAVHLGLGDAVEKINIGNIMLLIPGVAFTNSIRDMFGGDTITGLQRFLEAVILAITLASGFALATVIGGGML